MRKLPLDGFWLKLLAMVLMTVDHVGAFLLVYGGDESIGMVLRGIGRLSLPLFLFLLSEGVRHTRDPMRYAARIGGIYLLLEVGSAIAIYGSGEAVPSNPFTDLFYIVLVLLCLRLKGVKKLYALLPAAFVSLGYGIDVFEAFHPGTTVLWFPYFMRASYGIFGLLVGLAFYYAPALLSLLLKKPLQAQGMSFEEYADTLEGRKRLNEASCLLFALATILFWGITMITPGRELSGAFDMSFETYCLLSIPFLYLYNGKRGYDGKVYRYVTYLYFPVHLVVLFLIFAL
ncbi:MAG: TraX family protein [Candidatus Enteromonas sp.]